MFGSERWLQRGAAGWRIKNEMAKTVRVRRANAQARENANAWHQAQKIAGWGAERTAIARRV